MQFRAIQTLRKVINQGKKMKSDQDRWIAGGCNIVQTQANIKHRVYLPIQRGNTPAGLMECTRYLKKYVATWEKKSTGFS